MGFLGAFVGGLLGGIFKAFIAPFRDWWKRRNEIARAREEARRQEHERVEAERLAAEQAAIDAEPQRPAQEIIDDLNKRFQS